MGNNHGQNQIQQDSEISCQGNRKINMKTQIIVDLCCAIGAIEHNDYGGITSTKFLAEYTLQAKRLTKHMVEIASNLHKNHNVNIGKLNKALEKAGWLSKEFIIVKKVYYRGGAGFSNIVLVDIK